MSRSLAELDKYLVGHWRMENNFKDSSGEVNHGIPTDIEWKPTDRGMKPQCNGSTSYINCGTDAVYNVIGDKTISMWIKSDAYGGATEYVAYKGTSNPRWYFERGSNSINFTIKNDTISYVLGLPYDADVYNEWHHYIATVSSASVCIYVDGILGSCQDVTTFPEIVTSQILALGRKGGDSSNYYHGKHGNFEVWDVEFDADESLSLYNATKDTHGVIPAERSYTHRLTPPVDNSTVFATDMHTKSGYDLVDLSGNSNNGTVTGAVRSGGYFTDGMSTNGTTDNISVGDIS